MSSGRPSSSMGLNPPKAVQNRGASTGVTTRKHTTSFISPATGRTTEDMLTNPPFKASSTDASSAQKLLSEHALLPPSTDPSHSLLCNALLCITYAGVNAQLADVIRAVALLVNSLHPTPPNPYDDALSTSTLSSILKEQVDRLIATTDEIRTASSANTISAATLAELTDNTKQELKNASHSLARATEAHASSHLASPLLQKATYANVAKQNAHDRATAWCESQTHMVRITPSQSGPSSINDLDEEVLVEKANKALDLLCETSTDIPPKAKFLSARKAKTGSILYEVDSEETAAWIRTPEGQLSFTAHFGPDVSLATKPFPIIAEYVPVRTTIDEPETLRAIERNNELPSGSVRSIRWTLKPMERRSLGQRHAHAIIDFHRPTDANIAIKQGLRISGKNTPTQRLLPEPMCCMKCQSFEGGHFAKNCSSSQDVCGTCVEDHRTSACTISLQDDRYCANCKSRGHAAWERNCPTFKNLLKRHHAHLPDVPYRFYPVPKDSSSWELEASDSEPPAEHTRTVCPKPAPQPHPMFAQEDGWNTVQRKGGSVPTPPRPAGPLPTTTHTPHQQPSTPTPTTPLITRPPPSTLNSPYDSSLSSTLS